MKKDGLGVKQDDLGVKKGQKMAQTIFEQYPIAEQKIETSTGQQPTHTHAYNEHLNILLPWWLVFTFGILPVGLATGLIFYALQTGWLFGILLGLGWLVHIAIFIGLIYWVIRDEYL